MGVSVPLGLLVCLGSTGLARVHGSHAAYRTSLAPEHMPPAVTDDSSALPGSNEAAMTASPYRHRDAAEVAHDGSGCTSTMFVTPSRVCTWDGTETAHTHTVSSSYAVDCHGCQSVVVSMSDLPCPTRPTVATVTAAAPYTSWATVCSESGPATAGPSPSDVVSILVGREPAGQACTTTRAINPPQAAGMVSTAYRTTATETMLLDCAGCDLVLVTQVQGFGPPGSYTSTSTAARGTTTTYMCA